VKRLAKVAGLVALAGAAAAVAAIVFERRLAAPHYRGPQSDHFDGERFQNQPGGWPWEDNFLKWQLTRDVGPWREWADAAPGPKPPERVADGRLRYTFINHSTTLIQMDGVNILTDPIWSERCSPVSFAGPRRHRPPGIRFEDLPKIDVVLVSHNHYDHLDLPTLHALVARHDPLIVTPLGNGALMARHGIRRVKELDWWQSSKEPIPITSVPAQHFSSRGISDRDRNLWSGFVIGGRSGNVYFAGCTGWGNHFAEIGARLGPIRLALLPIGAFLPRWFMRPAHISPAEAVDAHRALNARITVPIHYGTFNLGDDGETEGLEELRRAVAAKKATGIEIVEFGQGREF
jgi:L-ascorbate metabolism protein UlaG (beta-lactamase superfamily)